nr:DUF4367 domain-containing protein [Clostridiales bacterium]
GAYNVLVLEKEDHTTFVWNNEDTLFMISGYITFDEAKQIMDSLVKV